MTQHLLCIPHRLVEMFKGVCDHILFQTCDTLMPICVLPAIDCELTEWSQWSECNKSCGKGHVIRTRMIQMEPQFGGAPCPETVQRKKCRIRKCLRNPSIQKLRWREARESRRSEQLKEESEGEQFPGMAPKCGPGLVSRTGRALHWAKSWTCLKGVGESLHFLESSDHILILQIQVCSQILSKRNL